MRKLNYDALINKAEVHHQFTVPSADRAFLEETLDRTVHHMVDKFVKGAKEHQSELCARVTFADILDEQIDQIFYTRALMQKMNNVTK